MAKKTVESTSFDFSAFGIEGGKERKPKAVYYSPYNIDNGVMAVLSEKGLNLPAALNVNAREISIMMLVALLEYADKEDLKRRAKALVDSIDKNEMEVDKAAGERFMGDITASK